MEALAIGSRSVKKHGVGQYHLSIKPPGPCPRCKDYRNWHWAKDCRTLKCKMCHKLGHKATKCKRKNSANIDRLYANLSTSVSLQGYIAR